MRARRLAADRESPRLVAEHRCREAPGALTPGLSCDLDRQGVDRGHAGDEGLELGVERARLVYVVLIDLGGGWTSRGHAVIMLAAPAPAQRAGIRKQARAGARGRLLCPMLRLKTTPQPEGHRSASSRSRPPARLSIRFEPGVPGPSGRPGDRLRAPASC